uniref:Peroxisomal biosis factor 26 n=1 Tax=Meleagris gallopavo TaxID=9103 RepID=A0A803Y469_MELGA
MNRWREVLSWVLQYYHHPEQLPPKILELCILLYSKVREPQVMLEVGSSWLRDQTNKSLPEYVSLLELYLLHVLLPLGRFEGAEELVYSCDVLDSEQKLAFVETICEKRCQWTQQEEMHSAHDEQEDKATETVLGVLSQKLLTMLTLLRRTLRSMSSHFYLLPYKKMLLATFLLYLVVVRLDPGRVLNKVLTDRGRLGFLDEASASVTLRCYKVNISWKSNCNLGLTCQGSRELRRTALWSCFWFSYTEALQVMPEAVIESVRLEKISMIIYSTIYLPPIFPH